MNASNPSTTCSSCGASAQEARGVYRFQESGLPNVFLINVGIVQCSHCGNEDPIIPHLNELMTKLALAVIGKPCPLNGSEVRFLRKFLNLTGDEFGKYLAVTKHHVSKWENDADPVGPQSDRLIRALTVCMGDNLKEHRNEIAAVFPGIEETIRAIEYKIDPEAEEVQYA